MNAETTDKVLDLLERMVEAQRRTLNMLIDVVPGVRDHHEAVELVRDLAGISYELGEVEP